MVGYYFSFIRNYFWLPQWSHWLLPPIALRSFPMHELVTVCISSTGYMFNQHNLKELLNIYVAVFCLLLSSSTEARKEFHTISLFLFFCFYPLLLLLFSFHCCSSFMLVGGEMARNRKLYGGNARTTGKTTALRARGELPIGYRGPDFP